MLKYLDYISESVSDKNIKFKKGVIGNFEIDHGLINYRLYNDNVLIFMGSLVDENYRGQGIFKNQLLELLKKFGDMDIYVPISNDTIINLFLRLGFEIYNEPIRYWGKPENAINMFRPASK